MSRPNTPRARARAAAAAALSTTPDPRGRPAAQPLVPAVVYARVSSKDQEKEGFSIPAQMKLLRSYADDHGFRVAHEFIDVETAKKAGRTSFEAMLAWLRRHPSTTTILVEKTDRLYRNLKDWVTLDGMDLSIHLVKEGVVLCDESRSHEKFIHGIKVLMAKNYIDNLSEEVRKGMTEKAEQGIWPSRAPMGYLNVTGPDGKRGIAMDPERAEAVRRMYELYATGTHSLRDVWSAAVEMGVTFNARSTNPAIATVHYILQNPIYKGEMLWNGTWYRAAHAPIVSPELWDRVQDALAGRENNASHPRQNRFAFTGVVRCGACSDNGDRRHLVGQIVKKKYIYYHCDGCRRAGRPTAYLREEVLDAGFVDALRSLRLDGPVLEWLREGLRASHVDERRFHDEAIDRLQKQYAGLQRRLDTAYEDRLDGRITLAEYEQRATGWRGEQERLRQEMGRHETADKAYTEEGIALLELAGMAVDLYTAQPGEEKRRLLDFMSCNSEFRNGKLVVRFKKPFDVLAESGGGQNEASATSEEEDGACPEWLPLGHPIENIPHPPPQ